MSALAGWILLVVARSIRSVDADARKALLARDTDWCPCADCVAYDVERSAAEYGVCL